MHLWKKATCPYQLHSNFMKTRMNLAEWRGTEISFKDWFDNSVSKMWNLSWLKLWNLLIALQLHHHFKVWNNMRWHDPSWRWAGNRVVCGHSCVNWYHLWHLCPNVPYLQKMLQFNPCHHKPTLNFRVEIIWGHRCILLCLLLCLMTVNSLFNKK